MTQHRSRRGSAERICPSLVPLASLFVLGWGTNQFSPLLLFYPKLAPIDHVQIQGLFVLYGVSLIPMLLLGGWLSDRLGRAGVVATALLLTGASSVVLMFGGTEAASIVIARVLTGIGAGIGFSASTAWVTETVSGARGSRLAVVVMTAGMGCGPLVVGVLAAWLLAASIPAPQLWVMAPHVLLALLALGLAASRWLDRPERSSFGAVSDRDETPADAARPAIGASAPVDLPRRGLRDRRFFRLVLPLGPWTLICTAVPLATLPAAVGEGAVQDPLLFSAFLTPLPALGGLCVQPLAGRARLRPRLLAPVALALASTAIALSVWAVHAQSLLGLAVCCFVFGLAHGLCQTVGLRLVNELSPPEQLGRNTAVFQMLTYLGYLSPLPIAMLSQRFPLTGVLLGLLALALLTLLVLLPLPGRRNSAPATP